MTPIHLIDDDPAMCESLAQLIGLDPAWQVRCWGSGAEFVAEAPSLAPAVVLVDHQMPGMSGLEVLDAIAGYPRFVPVMMTGFAKVRLAVQAMHRGAWHVIEKPCEDAVLFEVLAAARRKLEESMPQIEADAQISALTSRERQVLAGMMCGLANKVIANRLGISPRTVEVYRGQLLAKLGVKTLAAALQIAFIAGFGAKIDCNDRLAA